MGWLWELVYVDGDSKRESQVDFHFGAIEVAVALALAVVIKWVNRISKVLLVKNGSPYGSQRGFLMLFLICLSQDNRHLSPFRPDRYIY